VLAKYGPELEAGAILTVDSGRVSVGLASERESCHWLTPGFPLRKLRPWLKDDGQAELAGQT
jgi:hypothetical protein